MSAVRPLVDYASSSSGATSSSSGSSASTSPPGAAGDDNGGGGGGGGVEDTSAPAAVAAAAAADDEDEGLPADAFRGATPLGTPHAATVTSLAIDAPGVRMASASTDGSLHLYDLPTATSGAPLSAFRVVHPFEGGLPLVAVAWSPSGGQLLAAGGGRGVVVLSRDGAERGVTPGGDGYLHDVARCDLRRQVRVWRLPMAGGRVGGGGAAAARGRARPSAVAAADGLWVVATTGGHVWLYDDRAAGERPVAGTDAAGGAGGAGVSGLAVAGGGVGGAGGGLATRSLDDAVRLWDCRRVEAPVGMWGGLPAVHESTGVAFVGATSRYVVVGTSAPPARPLPTSMGVGPPPPLPPPPALFLLDTVTPGVPGRRLPPPPPPATVVSVAYHTPTDTLFTGSVDGEVAVRWAPDGERPGGGGPRRLLGAAAAAAAGTPGRAGTGKGAAGRRLDGFVAPPRGVEVYAAAERLAEGGGGGNGADEQARGDEAGSRGGGRGGGGGDVWSEGG
ncbi:hypothetical protein MMPV_007409 [Pyropia vietnamensis]